MKYDRSGTPGIVSLQSLLRCGTYRSGTGFERVLRSECTDNSFATRNANKRDRPRWKRCRPCQLHNTAELWLELSLTRTGADLDAAARELAEQLYLGTLLMPRRIRGGNTFVDVFAPQRIGSSLDSPIVSEVSTAHHVHRCAKSGFAYLSIAAKWAKVLKISIIRF